MGNCGGRKRPEESTDRLLRRHHQQTLEKEERDLFGLAPPGKRKREKSPEDATDGLQLETLETFSETVCTKSFDEVDHAALAIDVGEYTYPFENLVFEGGGNKGLALIGAVKCLEELGLMGQIRRFAGTSAGAITAAMVALGYPYEDLLTFWSADIENLFSDHSCGYLSFLPNVLRHFGWNPGKRVMGYFGKMISAKSKKNDPDMTFYDLYREQKVELCVVVTNLNQMSTEYCHPKTTPDMPIRQALRMSMSIPGVFTAPRYEHHGRTDIYVDGGMLCNYPIHCFDGWFLSMAREDAFLRRLQPLQDLPKLMASQNRFGEYNNKTLGFLLYSDTENEVMRYRLEKRQGALVPSKPAKDTKLWKEKMKTKEIKEKAELEHKKVVTAVEQFMKALHKHNIQEQDYIDKGELQNALNDTEEFPQAQAELLFGKNTNINAVFDALDKDGNGKIAFAELLQFIEERGIRLQVLFQAFGRREVNNFVHFLKALEGTMLSNMKYVFVKDTDLNRTVGINTGHIGTLDYDMDEEDREFAVARGYNATKTYLRYCIVAEYSGVAKK